MSASAHTPGPWTAEQDTQNSMVIVAEETEVASIIADDILPEGDCEERANARLIAAAPDLLAAALKAQCACSIKERDSGHLVDCWMPEMVAAIAKAKDL